jgi:hypothetical protein
VEDLLNAPGSSTTYKSDLIDVTESGAVIPVAGPLTLDGAEAWTTVPATVIAPGTLTLGHEYAVRVSSSYTPGTLGLFVSGNADFDNVALTATRPDPPVTPPSDGGGDDNGGGGDENSSLSSTELFDSVRRNTQETAAVSSDGSRVFISVTCPRSVKRACRISAQGRIGRKLAVTRRSTARVASGRLKTIALRVKPRFRQRVAERKRLVVVQRVRAGKVSTTFVRSRVLIRRG